VEAGVNFGGANDILGVDTIASQVAAFQSDAGNMSGRWVANGPASQTAKRSSGLASPTLTCSVVSMCS
jgi:hypothetical protein